MEFVNRDAIRALSDKELLRAIREDAMPLEQFVAMVEESHRRQNVSSNLPPGVSERMIPGNRPEDEWLDTFMENIGVPDDLVLAIDPKVLSSYLNVTMAFIAASRAEAFKAGQEDAKMDMPFTGRSFEADDPPVSFRLIRCEAIMPDKQIQCDREAGHHGDHHGFLHSSSQETWWQNDDS